MLNAPDLDAILSRLRRVPHTPWGPDGVHYVSILFWDEQGNRALYNGVDDAAWERWSVTSGEIWDLFLAGCYQYMCKTYYGDEALQITKGTQAPPVLWSESKSMALARTVESHTAGSLGEWTFKGPVELVVVGARRNGEDIEIDWPSLRSMPIAVERIATAIAAYTTAHGKLNAETLKDIFPAPGDFHDDWPPLEVARVMLRVIIKLTRMGVAHH
jgi:hypothetical protein